MTSSLFPLWMGHIMYGLICLGFSLKKQFMLAVAILKVSLTRWRVMPLKLQNCFRQQLHEVECGPMPSIGVSG